MNIFYLDKDITACAQAHTDSHVRKMILEYTQLLSAAYYQGKGNVWLKHDIHGNKTVVVKNPGQPEFRIYAKTHYNHPCSLWARENVQNWIYLNLLGIALCSEFEYRWGKAHATASILVNLRIPDLLKGNMTEPPKCMPDEFKIGDSIESYREYYKIGKQHLHQYTKREAPSWLGIQ